MHGIQCTHHCRVVKEQPSTNKWWGNFLIWVPLKTKSDMLLVASSLKPHTYLIKFNLDSNTFWEKPFKNHFKSKIYISDLHIKQNYGLLHIRTTRAKVRQNCKKEQNRLGLYHLIIILLSNIGLLLCVAQCTGAYSIWK